MFPTDLAQSIGPTISLSEEEYPRTLFGFESASELESLSSVFDQMHFMPVQKKEQLEPPEFYESKLCVLNAEIPWSPSIVIRNIISVPLETDSSRLEKLLLMTKFYEQTLACRTPKANVTLISILSKQLHALADLIEKIQKRIDFLKTVEAPLSNRHESTDTHNSSSSANSFFGLFTWISHKGHKEDLDPAKLLTDPAELEWSLETIQHQEKMLHEVNITGAQKLASLTVEQISAVWAKQQKAIKLLEKEQFYITNLSLLNALKIATEEQINTIRFGRQI